MGRWRRAEVQRCRGGEVERWRGGEVERWRGEEVEVGHIRTSSMMTVGA